MRGISWLKSIDYFTGRQSNAKDKWHTILQEKPYQQLKTFNKLTSGELQEIETVLRREGTSLLCSAVENEAHDLVIELCQTKPWYENISKEPSIVKNAVTVAIEKGDIQALSILSVPAKKHLLKLDDLVKVVCENANPTEDLQLEALQMARNAFLALEMSIEESIFDEPREQIQVFKSLYINAAGHYLAYIRRQVTAVREGQNTVNLLKKIDRNLDMAEGLSEESKKFVSLDNRENTWSQTRFWRSSQSARSHEYHKLV